MDRFACGGYLDITSDARDLSLITIRLPHLDHQHTPYCDIDLPLDICQEIDSRTGDIPSAIWSDILLKDPATQLTEEQIYARWMLANQGKWRLDGDQVKSAVKLLEQ
ncbi:hypothetical protein NCC49_005298 [Naganishia albida]|nr:hypothetical protein NCC49_005298 [Naganishia albida]